jgi:pimeloyl-ACP methyl ester carboxylesterase
MVRFDIPVEKLEKKYSTAHTKTVMVDGLRVYYNDEGRGVPLVLFHGFASSMQSWDGWNRVLSRTNRVISLDLPGFGLTGPNTAKDYSPQWYVGFIDKFLDALDIKECFLAGNSFGGRLALEYAYEKGPRVKKLILVDASGYPSTGKDLPAVKLSRTALGKIVFRWVTPRFLVAKNLNQAYSNPKMVTPQLIDRFYDFIRRAGNRDAFHDLSVAPRADLTEHIRAIKVPTLIMWGSKDPDVPVQRADDFHRDIAGSTLIVYDGAGHLPQEEIPDSSAADALKFLMK